MTIGVCELCNETPREVFTVTIPDEGTRQRCAVHGGAAAALEGIAGHLAVLGVNPQQLAGDPTIADGAALPASFFGEDGTLRAPPWSYHGTEIGVLMDARAKRATIVVPVSCMQSLSFAEMNQLVRLTAVVRDVFAHVAPKGWEVRT